MEPMINKAKLQCKNSELKYGYTNEWTIAKELVKTAIYATLNIQIYQQHERNYQSVLIVDLE